MPFLIHPTVCLGVCACVACLPGTAWYVGRFLTDPSRRFPRSFTHGYSSHEGHRQDQGPYVGMWVEFGYGRRMPQFTRKAAGFVNPKNCS